MGLLIILSFAVLNVGLGYAIAVYLHRDSVELEVDDSPVAMPPITIAATAPTAQGRESPPPADTPSAPSLERQSI